MTTRVHFLSVGQGNMTLIEAQDGTKIIYDCNILEGDPTNVLGYLAKTIGRGTRVDAFICSHRDADHMRGIEKLHKQFPILTIYDADVAGTTTNSSEYMTYMNLRRSVNYRVLNPHVRYNLGSTILKVLHAKTQSLAKDPNAQSIVLKVTHNVQGRNLRSVLLTGDTDVSSWKEIQKYYQSSDLKCDILLASHHGAYSYFEEQGSRLRYVDHLKAKSPIATIISVGNNAHGHPDRTAMQLYELHSKGFPNGNKLFRTDKHGHMSATLTDSGEVSLSWNR
jgi:beta-lactamase superfamily II metal-dependent hydrolase